MPLIDRTYFIGEINISNTNQPAVRENLDYLIGKREPELLKQLFGFQMYKAFTAGLQIDPVPLRWLELRDGADYTDTNGVECQWMGLITKDGEAKESLLANYVYYWFSRKEATQSSGVGEVISKTENSKRISPIDKQVWAWNEMVKWIYALYHFLDAKKTDYPELKPVNRWQWERLNAGNL